MIIVTIDLWSVGTAARKVLHTIKIANTGEGNARTGHYRYWIYSGIQLVKQGDLRDFPRLRMNGAQLLREVLNDAYGKDDGNQEI